MSNYLQIFITLLSLLNPVLAIGQYMNMTKGMEAEDKRSISIVCGLAVVGILGVFLFAGSYIMEGLSIHTYSLRLGGGVILLILGIKIILGDSSSSDRTQPGEKVDIGRIRTLGVSPLALPMVIGPASMVLVMIYGQDAPNLLGKFAILFILVILAVIITVTFILADYIARAIGDIGIVVITKSMGLIITAIAFEMIVAGMQSVVPIIMQHP